MAVRIGAGHTPTEHTSATQIAMMGKCGIQYEFRYIRGMKSPPAIAMLRGRAVDLAATTALKHKMETDDNQEPADVRNFALEMFERSLADEYQPQEDDDRDREILAVSKGSEIFASQILPTIRPAMVQQVIRVPFEVDGQRYDILGYLDWATVDRHLSDLKTALKKPTAGTADLSRQLTIYKMGYRIIEGCDPVGLSLEYIVTGKRDCYWMPMETTRDYADELALLFAAERMIRCKNAGNFAPAAPDAWWCSKKWCGYYYDCPAISQWHRNTKGTGAV